VGVNQGGVLSWRGLKVGQRISRYDHSQIKELGKKIAKIEARSFIEILHIRKSEIK